MYEYVKFVQSDFIIFYCDIIIKNIVITPVNMYLHFMAIVSNKSESTRHVAGSEERIDEEQAH